MGNHEIKVFIDTPNNRPASDPDSLVLKERGTQNIAWVIDFTRTPAGTKFTSNGIGFKAANPAPWPGTPPTRDSDTQFSTSEDVQTSNKGKYQYNIELELPDGTIKKADPDITNDPPSGPGGPVRDIELPEQAKGEPRRGPLSSDDEP